MEDRGEVEGENSKGRSGGTGGNDSGDGDVAEAKAGAESGSELATAPQGIGRRSDSSRIASSTCGPTNKNLLRGHFYSLLRSKGKQSHDVIRYKTPAPMQRF